MKTIIFDMDGVLIDSEYTFLNSKTEVLRKSGINKDISYQYQFMGTTFQYMWNHMIKDLGLPYEADYYISEMNKKREILIENNGVLPIKGVSEFIKYLFGNGFKLGVASSSPKEEMVKYISEIGLINHFEILVSGEEVEKSKPEPDIYLKAAKLLNEVPENCIAIEDTTNGVHSANAAGMYCIGFSNPDYPQQDLSISDVIVHSYKDAQNLAILNY